MQFDLAAPVEGGGCVRDHYKQAERQGARVPELHVRPPHQLVQHVWYYFVELHRGRPRTGFGAAPFTYESLHWWQRLRGIDLLPIELDILLQLDADFMEGEAERARKTD